MKIFGETEEIARQKLKEVEEEASNVDNLLNEDTNNS